MIQWYFPLRSKWVFSGKANCLSVFSIIVLWLSLSLFLQLYPRLPAFQFEFDWRRGVAESKWPVKRVGRPAAAARRLGWPIDDKCNFNVSKFWGQPHRGKKSKNTFLSFRGRPQKQKKYNLSCPTNPPPFEWNSRWQWVFFNFLCKCLFRIFIPANRVAHFNYNSVPRDLQSTVLFSPILWFLVNWVTWDACQEVVDHDTKRNIWHLLSG